MPQTTSFLTEHLRWLFLKILELENIWKVMKIHKNINLFKMTSKSCWYSAKLLGYSIKITSDIDKRKQPPEVFYKKGVLKNGTKFTGKHLCQSLFFNNIAELKTQVSSCEFCEIFKNTFFIKHVRTTASGQMSLGNCSASMYAWYFLRNNWEDFFYVKALLINNQWGISNIF